MRNIKQSLVNIYKLSRIYQYYGSVIFITTLGASTYQRITTTEFIILLSANMLMGMFSFSFNNTEDYKDDAKDPAKIKHNPISAGKIILSKARAFSLISLVLSLYFYYLLGLTSLQIGFVTATICFLYSWKKIRLKSKPAIDLVSHGISQALVFLNSSFIAGGNSNIMTIGLLSVLIFFISVLVVFESEIRDLKVDKTAKINNTISKINIKSSGKLIAYMSILSILLFLGSLILIADTLSIILMIILSFLIAIHFLFVWKRKSKFVYYYPYSQQVLIAYGLITFLL